VCVYDLRVQFIYYVKNFVFLHFLHFKTQHMATETKGADADVEEVNQEDNITTVLISFTQVLEQFITQLCTVFPECTKIQDLKQAFDTNFSQDKSAEERKEMAVSYISGWHQDFNAFYTQVSSEDDQLFTTVGISFLETTALPEKWTGSLHPDTKASIWEYFKNLCNLSNMYNIYQQVPSNMMNTIQSKALSIAKNLENGGSLQNVNIQELAVDIMKEVDMNELQAFAHSITNGGTDLGKIQAMCGSLMSMLGTQGVDMKGILQMSQLNQ
jgi:hypothetical protein